MSHFWKAQIAVLACLVFPAVGHAAFLKTLGFSESHILYTQDQSPSVNNWMHTIKAGLESSKDGSKWAYGFSGYASLSPSFTYVGDSSHLKFYGLNLRAAYSLITKKRFQLSLAAGYYYVTSVSSSYTGGFENLNGPQIYPSFRFTYKKAGTLMGYFKYSPVSSRFSLLKIESNYELAAGLTYFFKQQTFPFTIGVSLDLSEIKFNDPNIASFTLLTGSLGVVFVFGGS